MSKELIKLPELGEVPPPVWVDVLNTDDANKFLDKFVGDLYYDYIDPTYTFIMNIFQVVQEALDFVASLIPEFTDPISFLLNEIIEFVEAYLKDLRQTGIYFTTDDALKGEFKIKKFEGGYNRVAEEIVKKATNPLDYSRPDVSDKTAVLSITAYGGAGIDGLTKLLKVWDKFVSLFGVTKSEGGFLPPQVLPNLFLSQVGPTTVSVELDKLDFLEFDPVGFVAQWRMPQGKVNNFFEVNLPPAAFVLTITSRARPLPLFLERRTSRDTKVRTIISPLYISKDSNIIATSIILDRLNLDAGDFAKDPASATATKPFLFAKDPSGKKIPAHKLKSETKSFYKRTKNLGAIFGQTTFELELKYDEDLGGLKTYDIDTGQEIDVSNNYYYSIASYDVESPALEEGFNLTDKPQPFDHTVGLDQGLEIFMRVEKDRSFLAIDGVKSIPKSSRTQTVKLNYPSRMNYIKAMREAMTHVILFLLEESSHSGFTLSSDTKQKVLNIFHLKDVAELVKETEYAKFAADGYTVSEINDFRDNVKSLVDDGITRMLGRDEPSSIIKVVQPFIDTLLNDSEYPLLYPTLEYEFSGLDNAGYVENGTFNLTDLDNLSKLDSVLEAIPFVNVFSEPSDVQGIFPDGCFAVEESPQGKSVRTKVATAYFVSGVSYLSNPKKNAIHLSFEGEAKYAQFKYGQYNVFQDIVKEYPEKLKASFNLLGFIPENKLDREGAWKFKRLFSDGIVSVDEFFEEILLALKLLKDGFDSLVKFILDAIALLKQRIESIRQLIVRFKALIDAFLALRFPAGLSYLLTVSEGTEGYVDAILNAQNPPESSVDIYGTYATLVIPTAVPSIVVQILLGMLGDEAQEKVQTFFEGGTEIDPITGERKAQFLDSDTEEPEERTEPPVMENKLPNLFGED
tara:strand:+ start:8965 stop:11694 length:2730 start_codon:yes stop_codon:yes gene_type:complete